MKRLALGLACAALASSFCATAAPSLDYLARDVERAQAIRDVKNLQYTYAQYAQYGLWEEMSYLFAKAGVLDTGTEQLNGGGSSAVRGYAESTAFGDAGVVISNELHAPPFSLVRGKDNVDLFGFIDLASLNVKVDNESTDLRSVGLGVNYQFSRYASIRAAYGWQLKYLDRSTEHAHAHIAVNVSW